MPTSAQVLAGLSRIAHDAVPLAVAWHVALVVAALLRRPQRRTLAVLSALPLASVSLVAWIFGNPFNGLVFAVLAVVVALTGERAPTTPVRFGPPWAAAVGAALLAFAWTYPHFLIDQPLSFLYAAPLGLLPCPTLCLVIGAALLFDQPLPRRAAAVIAVAGAFYGLYGAFALGVTIDLVLIAGAVALSALALRGTLAHTALSSAAIFLRYLARGRIHQPRDRLVHVAEPAGTDFAAFRETVVDQPRREGEVRTELSIWFRLRFVHPQSRTLAALFRGVCIITTPFFSGFPGFVSKLWLEDRARAEYLGVYEFTSPATAAAYERYMSAVLRFFSQPGSIHGSIVPGETAAAHLAATRVAA